MLIIFDTTTFLIGGFKQSAALKYLAAAQHVRGKTMTPQTDKMFPTPQKMSSALKEAVEPINKEARKTCLPEESDKLADLEERVRESESKRLMLAEALYSSGEKVRRLIPGPEREHDRAQPFGVFVCYGSERDTAIIRHNGRLYETMIEMGERDQQRPPVRTFATIRASGGEEFAQRRRLRKGELLLLNNDLHVVDAREFDLVCGNLGTVQQVLSDEKLLIKGAGDERRVVSRADPLMGRQILAGDNIEYDPDSLFAYALLPKSEVDRLVLERVPDTCYEEIGGLKEAIQIIRDAIEIPHLYPEYFREHRLKPPKGILLYGPPGCGKTLIAKAVANSLTRRIGEVTGEQGESYFINVKGPELLNKYVGETEQAIRDLFARARNRATFRTPVIIFFDEMDSLFRVRGSGISSDMESTIVPQFLAELDGLEVLENVVVIGATNRIDLIDPAVLRPGRLDRKVRIPRPDRDSAVEIFARYLTPDLPLDPAVEDYFGSSSEAVKGMIERVVSEMYSLEPENELIEVFFANGANKVLYLKDFVSGAIIENVVRRAKFLAVKELIDKGKRGINTEHLLAALRQECKENEDIPNCANPAEWSRIIGREGERVVRVRTLCINAKEEVDHHD